MSLVIYEDDYGIYGYKNSAGEVVIEADFDTATDFSDGVAKVTSGGKSGTVNSQGQINWTSKETYEEAFVKPQNDVKEAAALPNSWKNTDKPFRTEMRTMSKPIPILM